MTRLAVRGNPAFTVSTLELRRRRPLVHARHAPRAGRAPRRRAALLLIGADSLDDFSHLARAGCDSRRAPRSPSRDAPAPAGAATRAWARRRAAWCWLGNPAIDVSSSRPRARAGADTRALPGAGSGRRYIERHRLYRR